MTSARAAGVLATVLALAGCHRHVRPSPGHVELSAPPASLLDEQVETPGDPGERLVLVTPGLVGGGVGRTDGLAGADVALEVGVHVGDLAVSHNDHSMGDRLFLPRGLLAPDQALGVVVGWSALRVLEDDADHTTVTTGPLRARGHVTRSFYGGGAGWAWDPRTGEQGPEVNLWVMFYDLRVQVTTDGELEAMLGLQLKWPAAWVWGR